MAGGGRLGVRPLPHAVGRRLGDLAGRRALLRVLGLGVVAFGLLGHAPYRQWQVYRKTRLLVFGSSDDSASVALADRLADFLLTAIPASRSQSVHARDAAWLVRLLASDQADVAVMAADMAAEARAGVGRFTEGALPGLRALAMLGAHAVLVRDDFPAIHAEALVDRLAGTEARAALGVPPAGPARGAPPVPGALPFHPAAAAAWAAVRPPR